MQYRYIQIIEETLKSKGLTAKKMLLDLGYSDNLLSQWKKGSEPSVIKLHKIATYLELSLDYLMNENNNNFTNGNINDIKQFPIIKEQILNQDEFELLEYFNILPDREKYILIGELKNQSKNINCNQPKSKLSGFQKMDNDNDICAARELA